MELAAMTVFEWIKSEFLAEVSDIREAIMNFEKSSITVWDPEHGEIQTDVYLPLPVQTLDTLPTYDVNSYASRVQSYVPNMKFDMPSTDVSKWVPPFEGMFSFYCYCKTAKVNFSNIHLRLKQSPAFRLQVHPINL